MKAKIYILEDRCIGCGACVLIAKDFFTLNNNKAKIIKSLLEKEEEIELAKKAEKSCPTNAIIVEIIED